ncbi:MAG: DNA translocase FtsK [Lachnospiraceae bacterium]|nr:DNA translocase FtsK [Lachnospiraceae bacterium]
MLGTFGILGYLMPIAIFIGICFKISNAANQVATLKLISALMLTFMIGILICYITGMDIAYLSQAKDMVKQLYDYQGGGGVIFGLVACWLYNIFGQAGSIFLALVLALVCLVIITERSILDKLKNGSIAFHSPYPEEEEDGQYALVPVDEDAEDADEFENRHNVSRQRDASVARKAKERQQRREEAQQKRRRLEEQKEDERIVNHSIHKEDRNKLDINQVLIEEQKKKSGHDDMHEITVMTPQPQLAEEKSGRGSQMHEITMPQEDIKEISIKDIPKVHHAMEEAPEPITAIKPVEEAATIAVPKSEPVIPMPDLSQMPQPVTERTHQNNAVLTPEPNENVSAKETETKSLLRPKKYEKPRISLLKKNENKKSGDSDQELKETALLLQQTLKTFGVAVTVSDISQGPSVTRYELQLGEGIKVNKIVNLADDIKLNLAAQDIRIEAPIPGKAAVGIELPNKKTSDVLIRDLIESNEFKAATSNLTFAVGKDITGKTIVADIAKMPHMLVAGATGSGKSVCINTLIMSILYKAHPDDVKLIMIDPKVVELSVYNGIPHLLIPVVTDPRKANAALQWAVTEMTKRYKAFADFGLRDLKGFNKRVEEMQERGEADVPQKMPQIVVIVDELADLMMVASKEVEESICRLAQLARAAGIHLVIATQRPSVDVITGLIKANMPSRVAFKVTSGVDSRTILDMVGAEKLLGKGDMLFYPQGYSKPLRVQGAFVSDQEVSDVVNFLKKNAGDQCYDAEVEQQIAGISDQEGAQDGNTSKGNNVGADNSLDAYFDEACRFVVEKEKASSGMLQRVFKIGYTRAARIVDQMEEAGVVGPEEGTKPRKVLMNSMQLEEFLSQKNK